MGAKCLVVYGCRGKYFIYYNSLDSFPEGLRQSIVDLIPCDPEEYQKWLESMRETHSLLAREFGEHHLPIFVDCDLDNDTLSDEEKRSRRCLALPPMRVMTFSRNDFDAEWIHTIDLDQEVLSIDETAHFQVSEIQPGVLWVKLLGRLAETLYNSSIL